MSNTIITFYEYSDKHGDMLVDEWETDIIPRIGEYVELLGLSYEVLDIVHIKPLPKKHQSIKIKVELTE